MKIYEIKRAAVAAWSSCSEHTNLLATASIVGSLESDFSASAKIEIFDISAKNNGYAPIGVTSSVDRFTRLAWGNPNPELHPMGIIAGGNVDGTIQLFDPSKILKNESENLVASIDKHTAPIKGLQFNPKQANLLASGGEDSQLCIWNLKNPAQPTFYALNGKNPHTNQVISALAWNNVFEYILATTSYAGTTVIWDLKQKRPLVPFSNPQKKKRYSAIAWNPEVATQVAIASEDDTAATIELWDVRQTVAPVKELEGHTKGILSMSWCPDDSKLLLTCGKDNRTILWNPASGEMLKELTAANNWMYDVQWSSRPSFFSTASFDGNISVYTMQDSGSEDYESNEFSTQMGASQQKQKSKNTFKTVPKWLQRPCGATFGFGKLVSFNGSTVSIHTVATEAEVVTRSTELEEVLKSGQYTQFCDTKIQQAKNENDKSTWEVLKILFEQNKSAKLLQYLGFDKQQISSEIDDKLANAQEEEEDSSAQNDEDSSKKVNNQKIDEMVSRAIMVADFERAVSCCLRANRMDDALILASCGGQTLWEKTKNEYFNRQKRPIMRVIAKVLNNKLDEVVGETSLEQWKDTLAIAATFANKDQFKVLTAALAARLETEKQDMQAAIVCYMLAGNMEKTVEFWLKEAAAIEDSREALISLVERVIIFQQTNLSASVHTLNSAVAEKYAEYAKLLSSQGLLSASLRYLNMLSAGKLENQETALLRHRIYYSLEAPFGTTPQLPFTIRRIVPKPVQQHVQAQQQQQQRAPVQPLVARQVQPKVHQQQPMPAAPTNAAPTPFFQPNNAPANLYPTVPQHVEAPNPYANVNAPNPYAPTNTNTSTPPPAAMMMVPSANPAPMQPAPVADGGFKFGLPPAPYVPQPAAEPMQPAPPAAFGSSAPASEPLQPVLPPANIQQPQQPSAKQPTASKAKEAAPAVVADTPTAVDISGLEGEAKHIATVLLDAFNSVFSNANLASQHASKKRIISKDLAALFTALVRGEIAGGLLTELASFATAIQEKRIDGADKLAKDMGTTYFEESKNYQKGLKFLVQTLK